MALVRTGTILTAVLIATPLVWLPRSAAPSQAHADWSQWRGPARDGSSEVRFESWPEELELVWSTPVGLGHSSPVVGAGVVYQFARQEGDEVLQAIDLETGEPMWRVAYGAAYRMNPAARFHGPGPKSTPLVVDGRVFTLGISGILSATDVRDSSLLWQHEFAGEFDATSPVYGTAMSPVAEGDSVIAHVGGADEGALVAFDAASGSERWRWSGDGPGYASPVVVSVDGSRMLVTQTQRQIVGIDAASGELRWSLPLRTDYDQNSVTPLQIGGRLVLSGLDNGIFAVGLSRAGAPDEYWRTTDASMYMSSPVLALGRLFGFSHRRAGQFFALDPNSGQLLWGSRGREGDNAAILALGHHVVWLTDEARLLVTDAAADEFAPIAEYEVADSPTWAHPAVITDGLLIKDHDHLTRWRVTGSADGS